MNPTAIPPCPKCGGTKAKLTRCRDIYPALDPHHRSPPTAAAQTFECPCGSVFVVKVRYEPQ